MRKTSFYCLNVLFYLVIHGYFILDIPDYGVTMAASPLPKSFDSTGWWVFEKYDGIRAISLHFLFVKISKFFSNIENFRVIPRGGGFLRNMTEFMPYLYIFSWKSGRFEIRKYFFVPKSFDTTGGGFLRNMTEFALYLPPPPLFFFLKL
jgi:hypothetical protein